jgi:hypothetical protein
MNVATLVWGIVFGSIGLGFFVYGRKKRVVIPTLSGLTLMLFPYFISNPYIMALLGVVLIALPFLIRI